MGIYDRDYYRGEGSSFLGAFTDRGRMCKWLILANIVCFILQVITPPTNPGGLGAFTDALDLLPEAVLQGQVWRLLTHAFLHDTGNLLHIIINMLLLWWFGSELEDLYGSMEFLALYLTAAIGSGLMYMLWALGSQNLMVAALGASGAVSAVFVLYACHYPRRIVLLFFVIPVPIWLLATLYVAWDLLSLRNGQSDVAHASHVGGALIGVLYYVTQVRLLNLVPNFRAWGRKRQHAPQLRVYRGDPETEQETPVPVPGAPRPPDGEELLEAKLDAVLEKVSRVGKENLTESEKAILLKASEFYRRRRT